MKTNYVVGFLFRDNFTSVVLIQKSKPAWQAGLYNGVGGKIEGDETAHAAMAREFKEETGADVAPDKWRKFCLMTGVRFDVHCFVARDSLAWEEARTIESEPVLKLQPDSINRLMCVSNLKWMIEMAMDDNDGNHFMATVQYP